MTAIFIYVNGCNSYKPRKIYLNYLFYCPVFDFKLFYWLTRKINLEFSCEMILLCSGVVNITDGCTLFHMNIKQFLLAD